MAAKYQLITELYQRTGAAVSRNPQAWQSFLSSACRNYKCRFDEQLLIFAQRPDATAVTTLETWNRQFKRWVNKDSRGIAVFDTKGRRNTLKYYFDVSDTHEGYYNSRPVPIWQMNERYEQAVIERLSDRFGNLESGDLGEALMQTAKNAVEDNLPDYLAQLKECTKDSFLEELDDFNVEVIYKRLAVNSVTFMLMSRCGLDTGEYFETEDFSDIINFNTPATINAIGLATSDISEMVLREISQTVRNVQIAEKNQNRTFASTVRNQYDKGRKQSESLISIIGLLNRSYKGEYLYDGVSVSALTDRELSMLRANNIGFVFQNYSLIKHLRVWENIELPLLYAKKNMDRKQRQEVIRNLLKSVGLEDKENDYPANLSGGEQQRVAIARALTVSPEAILCDEPTGALDKKTGQQIMELLLQIVRENNIMLLLVTHDSDIANTCDTIFEMDEGRLRCAKNDF